MAISAGRQARVKRSAAARRPAHAASLRLEPHGGSRSAAEPGVPALAGGGHGGLVGAAAEP
eukprot:9023763-Alexandrium_andersonii.AAC.1